MSTCSGYITVGNERGIHSRIATRLAEIAGCYEVEVTIGTDHERADGSMILDVLALGLIQGDTLQVVIRGQRSVDAMQAVQRLLTAKDDPK
nr:HPr family phosphocarrier protein [uncultured Desulfobulbus sp.]